MQLSIASLTFDEITLPFVTPTKAIAVKAKMFRKGSSTLVSDQESDIVAERDLREFTAKRLAADQDCSTPKDVRSSLMASIICDR